MQSRNNVLKILNDKLLTNIYTKINFDTNDNFQIEFDYEQYNFYEFEQLNGQIVDILIKIREKFPTKVIKIIYDKSIRSEIGSTKFHRNLCISIGE